MPEQIDDDPRRVAWSLLNTPPKKDEDWRYLSEVREDQAEYEGDEEAEES